MACTCQTKLLTCAVFAMAATRAWAVMENPTQARHSTFVVSAVAMAGHAMAATVICTRTKRSTVAVSAVVTTRLAVAVITFLIQVRL